MKGAVSPHYVMDVVSPSPSSEYSYSKINYISTQLSTTMYFLPYWLRFSAITTTIRQYYTEIKKTSWLHAVREMLSCMGSHLL
jgi:hypothetical protein